MELKDKLRALRSDFHCSQEDIADYLQVSRQAVSRWETGAAMPCTENLIKLSQLYQVSLYELEDGAVEHLSFQVKLLNHLLKTTVPRNVLNQNIEYIVMEHGWSQEQYDKLNLFLVQAWNDYPKWTVDYFRTNLQEVLTTNVSTIVLYQILNAYSSFTQRALTPDFNLYPSKNAILRQLDSLSSQILPSPIQSFFRRLQQHGLKIDQLSEKEPSYIGASAGCGFSLHGWEEEIEIYLFDPSDTQTIATIENLQNIQSNRPLTLYLGKNSKIEQAIDGYAYHQGLLLCQYLHHPAKDLLRKALHF